MSGTNMQKVVVPLPVGSRVTLMKDVEIDSLDGSSATIFFEDYVEQHIPQTGYLEFTDSDIGRAEFNDLVEKADEVEIISNYQET